jgi:hypothetical protein
MFLFFKYMTQTYFTLYITAGYFCHKMILEVISEANCFFQHRTFSFSTIVDKN